MNPNALICACGCYVQTNDEAKQIEGVDILVGNGNKKNLVTEILKRINEPKKNKYVNIIDVLHMHTYEPLDVTSYDHTRAFVKIEDGCENFCTFCIIRDRSLYVFESYSQKVAVIKMQKREVPDLCFTHSFKQKLDYLFYRTSSHLYIIWRMLIKRLIWHHSPKADDSGVK